MDRIDGRDGAAARYPMDYDALNKGDVLPAELLERLLRARRGTEVYRLGLLGLRDQVVRECGLRGRHFTVVVRRDQLCVLTDEEAAEYNARAFHHGVRRSKRSLRRLVQVDAAALTAEQRREHERNVLVCGKMLQSALNERRLLTARPHVRTTPGLPAPAARTSQGEAGPGPA